MTAGGAAISAGVDGTVLQAAQNTAVVASAE
jgi:hypothetical protein